MYLRKSLLAFLALDALLLCEEAVKAQRWKELVLQRWQKDE